MSAQLEARTKTFALDVVCFCADLPHAPEIGHILRIVCLLMSLVEEALGMTPEQRLEEHQHALNLVLEIEASRERNAPR